MTLASSGGYALNVLMFSACALAGTLAPIHVLEYVAFVAVMLGLVIGLAAMAPKVLGSGARSTLIQLMLAMPPGLYVGACMEDSISRVAFAMQVSGALVWGVLWLNARLYLVLTATYTVGYAILAALLASRRPEAVDLVAEVVAGGSLMICGASIAALGAYVSSVRSRLKARSAELNEMKARIEQQALRDELTGLANRRRAMQVLREAAVARADEPLEVSTCLLDIDHFKRVNDVHGHGAGDTVLRRVAAALSAAARPGDTVGRLGGEELLLVMPATAAPDALVQAERLRQAVAAVDFGDIAEGLRVTVSCGVSSERAAPGSAADPDVLLQRADQAMYRAKSAGRNRVEVAA